jgi:hypothetical protein
VSVIGLANTRLHDHNHLPVVDLVGAEVNAATGIVVFDDARGEDDAVAATVFAVDDSGG